MAPQLSGIYITCGGSIRGNSTDGSAAFRKGLIVPCDFYSQISGESTRTATKILRGALDAGTRVDTLVMGGINYRFLSQSASFRLRMREIVKKVKHLQWDIGYPDAGQGVDANDGNDTTLNLESSNNMREPLDMTNMRDTMETVFVQGLFMEYISDATNLRT